MLLKVLILSREKYGDYSLPLRYALIRSAEKFWYAHYFIIINLYSFSRFNHVMTYNCGDCWGFSRQTLIHIWWRIRIKYRSVELNIQCDRKIKIDQCPMKWRAYSSKCRSISSYWDISNPFRLLHFRYVTSLSNWVNKRRIEASIHFETNSFFFARDLRWFVLITDEKVIEASIELCEWQLRYLLCKPGKSNVQYLYWIHVKSFACTFAAVTEWEK